MNNSLAGMLVASLFLVSIGFAKTYTTNFPLTEDPISENSNWINAGTTDWATVYTPPGKTHHHSFSGGYSDATALLTGSWGADQMGQATVWTGTPHLGAVAAPDHAESPFSSFTPVPRFVK